MIHTSITNPEAENEVYISTEDNRIDTSVPSSQVQLLFEITNDMGQTYGVIPSTSPVTYTKSQYTYPVKYNIYDRYTKATLTASVNYVAANVFTGKFLAVSPGYYYYKVFECTTTHSGAITPACNNMPNNSSGKIGRLDVTDIAGTVIYTLDLTGKNDVYEKTFTNLSAQIYPMKIYNSCNDLIVDYSFVIATETAQTDGTRYMEIKNVVQTSTGITFDIKSNMPGGHSYSFTQGSGSETQITNITTKPQTTSHSFAQVGNPLLTANLVTIKAYDAAGGATGGGSEVGGGQTIVLRPVMEKSSYYGIALPLATNNVLNSTAGAEIEKGNSFVTAVYGATATTTDANFYVLQGMVEQGKMYVTQESEASKEIKYTQYVEDVEEQHVYNQAYD